MTPQKRRRRTVTGAVMIAAWLLAAAGWIGAYAIGKCGKLGLTAGMLCCIYGLMNAVQTIIAARKEK